MLFSYLTENIKDFNAAWSLLFVVFLIALGYVGGSLDGAKIVARLFFKTAVKKENGGFVENQDLYPLFGAKALVLAMVFEMLRGAVLMYSAWFLFGYNGVAITLFFAVFGQLFPLFNHFKGGSGVWTAFACVLYMHPLCFALLGVIFLIMALGTKLMPLAYGMTAMMLPLILKAFNNNGLIVAMSALATVFMLLTYIPGFKAVWSNRQPKVNILDFLKYGYTGGNKND